MAARRWSEAEAEGGYGGEAVSGAGGRYPRRFTVATDSDLDRQLIAIFVSKGDQPDFQRAAVLSQQTGVCFRVAKKCSPMTEPGA